MGFCDCRCMATKVSLNGADAAAVLLQKAGGRYVPIALAIKGTYDQLGSIDGIKEDANTRRVLRYFLEGLRSTAFRVNETALAVREGFPIETAEHLLRGFERNMNDSPGHAVLNGKPVVFALIARAVWDAVARAAPRPTEPASAAFGRLFGTSSVGAAIYGESLREVSGPIGELAAVDAFLEGRELRWKPTKAAGQHSGKQMRRYLAAAQVTFADSATVTTALGRYAKEVEELLEDE